MGFASPLRGARELPRRAGEVTGQQREQAERVSGFRRVPGITEVKRRLERALGVPAAVLFSPEGCLECRKAAATLIAALRCSHLLDDCYGLEGVRVRAPQIAAVPLELRVHVQGVSEVSECAGRAVRDDRLLQQAPSG